MAAEDAPDDGYEAEGDPRLPPHLRLLMRLVTVLTVVMIAGFTILIIALVLRLSADPLPLPERISLPDGVEARAFTQGVDWIAVVGSDDRIFVFSRASGALIQTVEIGEE